MSKFSSYQKLILSIITFVILNSAFATNNPPRTLHFPAISIGKIYIQDSNTVRHFDYCSFWGPDYTDWEYFGEASNTIRIPTCKRVRLNINRRACKDLSFLAKLKADDLYMLVLPFGNPEKSKFNNQLLDCIKHLTGLKVLYVQYITITNKDLKTLQQLKSLERLWLPPQITTLGLGHLTSIQSLKAVYCLDNKITRAGFKHISKLQNLEELAVSSKIGAGSFAELENLKSLRCLCLWGTKNKEFKYLEKIPSLRAIDLTHSNITDKDLIALSKITWLEELKLYNTKITDKGLAYLKSLTSLKRLDIGKSGNIINGKPQISDEGMIHLSHIKSLEHLDMFNLDLTDKGLSLLAKLPKLKGLNIPTSHYVNPADDKYDYTDKGLNQLAKLKSLETLMIGGSAVTDKGMTEIAKLTNLKDLRLVYTTTIADDGLAELNNLKALERLSLSKTKVTISGLSKLNNTSLKKLIVSGIQQDDSVLDISRLKKLDYLTLGVSKKRRNVPVKDKDKISDEDLACLRELKNLRSFSVNLYGSKISDKGISYLKDLTNMEKLFVSGQGITDKSLSYISKMKKLSSLTISGYFTDEGLKNLIDLKAISILKIYSKNDLSYEALRELAMQLPNLGAFETGKNWRSPINVFSMPKPNKNKR